MRAALESAALELLEAQLAASYDTAIAARAGQRAPEIERPRIDPVLCRRVLHLMGLEQRIEAGVRPRMWADELLGLESLRAARARFNSAHPCCAHCNAPLVSSADTRCWRCWQILEKEQVR